MIGFVFIESNVEFEKWQRDNPSCSVCTVQPHAQTLKMMETADNSVTVNGDLSWGVFVTYRYDDDHK